MAKTNRFSLMSLFLVLFLDMIGIGLIIPILAPLLLTGDTTLVPLATSIHTREIILGFLMALYPLAQFFASPIIGTFADKYGRKPVLLVSLAGTFLGYVLFAVGIMTGQLWLLFLSRLIDGATGGNISVVHSAVADVSEPHEKAKNFGVIGMAFGFGFIIGPFVGGILSDSTLVSWFTFATPFWFAGALSLINFVAVGKWFKETLHEPNKSIHISVLTGIRNIIRAFKMPSLRVIFTVVFLQIFGFAFFTQFFQVYMIEKFGITQRDIGFIFGYLGVWVALVQGTLVRIVAKKVAPHRVLRVSLIGLAIAIPLLLLAPSLGWIYLFMPLIAIFNGLTMPNTNAVVSNSADRQSQGEAMGMVASLQSLGTAVPPMIAGFVVSFHLDLPIIIAGTVIMIAWIVFMALYRPATEQFREV